MYCNYWKRLEDIFGYIYEVRDHKIRHTFSLLLTVQKASVCIVGIPVEPYTCVADNWKYFTYWKFYKVQSIKIKYFWTDYKSGNQQSSQLKPNDSECYKSIIWESSIWSLLLFFR